MDRGFTLISSKFPRVGLRTITEGDLETLRKWKNENRRYFFFQGIISPRDQRQWFQGYLNRKHDYMFIVTTMNLDIGCMGFRLLDGNCDIYNVILGLSDMGRKRFMGDAFHIMCSYAVEKYQTRLVAKVLSNNPNINWYNRNGFFKIAEDSDHLEVELDQAAFQICPVIEFQSFNKQRLEEVK